MTLRAVLAWCLAATFALLAIGATATAAAAPATRLARDAASGYDAVVITHLDSQAIGDVDTGPGLFDASLDRFASPPTSAQGTSTTFLAVVIATNGLDDVASGLVRPAVSDPKLSHLMDELYRPGATIGSGSTADAVRYELQTGLQVGGRWEGWPP